MPTNRVGSFLEINMHQRAELVSHSQTSPSPQVSELLSRMTIQEKIGQLAQVSGNGATISEQLAEQIRQGRVGSVINEVDSHTVDELQRIATQESRLKIPLLIGRDVIHGFKTIFPIPLGQAASWNAELVEQAARVAAAEASTVGVNWTFAPMIDISRDPRWGRIAESLGEDPHLCSVLGVAMVRGFQSQDMSQPGAIAACAKHFAGYGAAESGRDYSTTNIPENELRNVYLPPFHAAVKAGVATIMSSFSDLNGVPASGNKWLMSQILRDEWQFDGFVVSDWESVSQLQIHGLTENEQQSACQAFDAGIDMEMVSSTYRDHLEELLNQGQISHSQLDASVIKILTLKQQLGLFEHPFGKKHLLPEQYAQDHLALAKELAIQSCVLLKNEQQTLPLQAGKLKRLAVIGPMADDGYEQLGTWIFDGEHERSVTCLSAIKQQYGEILDIQYCKALDTSRSHSTEHFEQAVSVAQQADVALLFMGEESILSGEAHCRADIDLPGAQEKLIEAVAATGTPLVLIVMAGRPLTLEPIVDKVQSLLYAWHPGTMGGPAICDLLFGQANPSGKLPVTFPRKVGQIPLYYAQKHSGKPANEAQFLPIDEIPVRSAQTSLGMAATHLDTHYSALFEFGFGLSYATVEYTDLQLDKDLLTLDDTLNISVSLHNTGDMDVTEVAQLYIRDLAGSVTRPVKELKQFKLVTLPGGATRVLSFALTPEELGFYDRDMLFNVEPGKFIVWVGASSAAQLCGQFEVLRG